MTETADKIFQNIWSRKMKKKTSKYFEWEED
jgi:hypothetical protein